MPSKDQHVKKAIDNEEFASNLGDDTQASINWKLVVFFYAALHYVEAYLAKQHNMHLRLHTTRDSEVSREANLKKIRKQYAHLKFYGFNARYEVDQFTAKDTIDAAAYLAQIRNAIAPLL